MSPAPMIRHQELATQIVIQLGKEVENCDECSVLMEVDYKISDDTVLRPDVVLTCGETHEAYLTKTPNIVFEIIGPATARRDEHYKFHIYEKEKVPWYVLVYPESLVAKIYKNVEGRFDKRLDATTETFRFEDDDCPVTIDFEKIFSKYRKGK